jgi:predicted regulator of Ras-like GTPase activity (Roadblock/LC7/MglB family)
MPTLKDLLARLSNRSEVEAVYVVGQDGLLIDKAGSEGSDAEAVAAMAPNLLQNARELGAAANHDGLKSAVVEYTDGVAIVTDVSSEMVLVTFVKPGVPFGALLYELRHNREQIARLL